MNMEKINDKAQDKSRLFAQYIWQRVWVKESVYGKGTFPINPEMIYNPTEEEYLVLKNLATISDEDAMHVAEICYYNKDEDWQGIIPYGKSMAQSLERGIKVVNAVQAYQYLQSKSYALPFMHYSVSDLTNMGWIQLTNK